MPVGTSERWKVYFSNILKEEPQIDGDEPSSVTKTTKPITSIEQSTGVTKNQLLSRKYIAWMSRGGVMKVAKIIKVRITKVLAAEENGNHILVPISIILKEDPKAPENWK